MAVQPFLCSDSSDTAATQLAQGEKTYCHCRHDNTKIKHIVDASIIATREAVGVRYQMMALQFSTNGGGAFQRYGRCGWGVDSATTHYNRYKENAYMSLSSSFL